MRHLLIAGSLLITVLLSVFVFPVWAMAMCWFAVLVVTGTSLLLRRVDESE
jgi:hypothetical protein